MRKAGIHRSRVRRGRVRSGCGDAIKEEDERRSTQLSKGYGNIRGTRDTGVLSRHRRGKAL